MRKIILGGVAVLLTAAALTAYHIRKDKHNHNGSCETRHSHDEHDHNAHENERKHESHDDHPTSKEHDGHDHDAPPASKEHDGHDHDAPSADSTLHLTIEQRNLIGLKIAEAAPGQLENTLQLDGEIRYNLEKMAKVMPRLPGFVSRINAIEGQQVRKGEILAVLQSWKLGEIYSDYNANKELEKLNLAEFKIAERLREKNAMAEIDYLKAKRQYADAQIARRRAEASLTALGLDPNHIPHGCRLNPDNAASTCTEYEMTAPLDGIVVTRDITPGENYAEDNTKPSFTIADTRKLWLELRARQEDLPHLRTGQQVEADLGKGFAVYHGQITHIAPAVDETTRTIPVRALIDNTDGKLKPGLFAVGLVKLEKTAHSLLVPRGAVQSVDGESVVFVPKGDGFATRPVKTGRSDRNFCEITAGLEQGEKYVANGAFELKSMIVTAGMDPHAGHGH